MRILQISIAFAKNSQCLYADLANALAHAGHEVFVAAIDAKASDEDLTLHKEQDVNVVRIRAGKIFNTNLVRKALTFIMLPYALKSALKKHFSDKDFDLVLFEAPPVTIYPAVKWAKKYFKCPAYLMQKDIFPQNAVDLGMMKKNSPAHLYFRRKEIQMLKTADYVGCMSLGNVEYVLNHNKFLSKDKVELFPNTAFSDAPMPVVDKRAFRAKYNIPQSASVFLFAGNMGKPQNVGLICSAMKHFDSDGSVFFVAIGSGTESHKVRSFVKDNNLKNSIFLDSLPRSDYELLAAACDVGIVSLDPRYTIPNYPSKTLSYMQLSMPIVAATDLATDYKDLIISQANCGLWSDASKPKDFYANILTLAKDADLRLLLGNNGRKYMINNFDISRSVKILEGHFKKA